MSTTRRFEALARGSKSTDLSKCQPSHLDVIVVDNDPNGSACAFCEQIKSEFKWILQCDIEPRRGIPFARNKALACLEKDVDFVAFIDDDEVPAPLWLDELLSVQASYKADTVSGPVLPHFAQAVPAWVTKGRFFERPRHATGHLVKGSATNNVLVRADVLRKLVPAFDERLALCGGSDWHFLSGSIMPDTRWSGRTRRWFMSGYLQAVPIGGGYCSEVTVWGIQKVSVRLI